MKGVTPVLMVRDLEVSARFYQESLGFSEWFRYKDGNGVLETVGVEYGGVRLILDRLAPGATMVAGGMELYIDIGAINMDEYYAKTAPKVNVISPPEVKPWGDRTYKITDPDGHPLVFLTPAQ
ncbi:MAG TPA: VOC family protein [Symbiobacteriaceae bacterium]|nr:VOC family protein [Symbiobacteriaceae bacterium]